MLQTELKKLETLGPVGIRIRAQLVERYDSLNTKGVSNHKPAVILMINKHNIDYDIMIQLSHSMIATGTSEGQNFSALAIAIGTRVRNFYNAPLKAADSFRLGSFILSSYGVLELVLIKLVNDLY